MAKPNIDKRMKELREAFGANKIRRASEIPPVRAISSGVPGIDNAIGIGGYPIGGVVQVWGPKGVGKSALSYLAIAEFQKVDDRIAAIVNVEGTFDEDFAKCFGVDTDRVIVQYPFSAEETRQMAISVADFPDVGFVCIDSVGAMQAESEQDPKKPKKAYGASGIITAMIETLIHQAIENQQIHFVINQVRDKQNPQNLPIFKPTGGNALGHGLSVSMQLKPAGAAGTRLNGTDLETGEKKEVASQPTVYVDKNKVGPSYRTANYWFYHTPSVEYGPKRIDVTDSTITVGLAKGVITQEGTTYRIPSLDFKIVGRNNLHEWLQEDRGRIDAIRAQLFPNKKD